MEYKRASGEDWREDSVVELRGISGKDSVVELRGISGKDSVHSPEFQPVFEKVRAGQANTVICPALDRVCRSVADFLALFEFLRQHGVEFISLRENFDTATPQGQFVATV